MNLRILDEAAEEFQEATLWYLGHKSQLSELFDQAVQQTLLAIEREPLRFATVEFAGVESTCRRAMVAKFPYVVIFQILKTEVVVISIVHTSRYPKRWIERTD